MTIPSHSDALPSTPSVRIGQSVKDSGASGLVKTVIGPNAPSPSITGAAAGAPASVTGLPQASPVIAAGAASVVARPVSRFHTARSTCSGISLEPVSKTIVSLAKPPLRIGTKNLPPRSIART